MATIAVWNTAVSQEHYGSVAGLVHYGDALAILSASHVLAPMQRGLSPGASADIGCRTATATLRAGRLANWDVPMTPDGTPLTFSSDSAIASLDAVAQAALVSAIPMPASVRRAENPGETAYFLGATTGECRRTVIHDVAAQVVMLYRMYEGRLSYTTVPVLLSGLIQCDAGQRVQGGDSGCLLFDARGCALGILLGTDATDTYPYFAHLQPILDAFGTTMVTASDVPNGSRLSELIG